MTRATPTRPNPVHIEGGNCPNCRRDEPRLPEGVTLSQIIALAESLPVHSISGYEWECAECSYNWEASEYQDRRGNGCDHAIPRKADGSVDWTWTYLGCLWFVLVPGFCVGIAFAYLVGWMP